MELKQSSIEGMQVKQLRKAVRQLDVSVESYGKKQSLATGRVKPRRMKTEASVEFLSEKEVKRLCDCEESVPMVGRRS